MPYTTQTIGVFARSNTGEEDGDDALLSPLVLAKNYTGTLQDALVPDTRSMTLVDNTPFSVGDRIQLIQGTGVFSSYRITGINVDGKQITVDRYIDLPFDAGATVLALDEQMNKNAAASRLVYAITPGPNRQAKIKRIMFNIVTNTEPNFQQFGDRAALVNGITFRKRRADGTFKNYGNIKTNGQLSGQTYDTTFYYESRNSQDNGIASRLTWTKFAGVITLNPGDYLEAIVNDDLSTLQSMVIIPQGKLT